MSTLSTRQSDDNLGMDNSYDYYDSHNCYEEGRCSWWWSDTGSAVRYTIVAILFTLLFAYFLGGYWHARRRVRKNLPPLAYHRWMVKRRTTPYPRYWGSGAPMYHNASGQPYYAHPPPGHQQHPDYYGMQSSSHAPPPPAYHAGDAPPPVYQPPQGGSKVAADQSFGAEGRGEGSELPPRPGQ